MTAADWQLIPETEFDAGESYDEYWEYNNGPYWAYVADLDDTWEWGASKDNTELGDGLIGRRFQAFDAAIAALTAAGDTPPAAPPPV